MKKIDFLYLFLWGTLFPFISCTQEQMSYPEENNEQEVTLQVQVSSNKSPFAYLIDESLENKISNIDVLLFDKDLKLVAWREGNDLALNSQNALEFKCSLPFGTYKYLYVVANGHDEISNSGVKTGDSFTNVINNIQVSHQPSTPWSLLPMSGLIPDIGIDSKPGVVNLGSVRLFRSVAAVRVKVAKSVGFGLSFAQVYFAEKEGTLLVDPNNISGSEIIAPNVPVSVGQGTLLEGPMNNADEQTIDGVDYYVVDGMYVFENLVYPSTSSFDVNRSSRLVVRGSYQGTPYYYGIDFVDSSTKDLIPIIRNCLYDVTIRSVSSSGGDKPEDVLNNLTNIAVTVTVTDYAADATVIQNNTEKEL